MPPAAKGVLLRVFEAKPKESVASTDWASSSDGAWLKAAVPRVGAVCCAQGSTEVIGFHVDMIP
jgi:hypothetical protein